MALRKEFAFADSEFNDFLFAPIGDEGGGRMLSVLSALARLDIDPWREAARLSGLSRSRAVQALVVIIARLPGDRWAASEAGEIATRLAAFLPKGRPLVALPSVPVPARRLKVTGTWNPRLITVMVVLVSILVGSFLFGRPSSSQSSEDAGAPAVSQSEAPTSH